MIRHSLNRHHKGMNTFYTKECRDNKIKTIHSDDRWAMLNDFFEMIKEDILVYMQSIKLPIGLFKPTIIKNTTGTSKTFLNYVETKKHKIAIYYDNYHTNGYKPIIRWKKGKIRNIRFWKLNVRDDTKKFMGREFIKDFKKFIR